MKNIHILPTENPSRLCIDNSCNELNYSEVEGLSSKHITNQNIYITSDEEIKEGDWFITTDTNEIHKSDWIKFIFNNGKKIILTTDVDLIKDGVQAIPDEFLEWIVKNPSCEEVIVTNLYGDYNPIEYFYEIIIPKEEPKQKILYREYLKNSKGGVCSFEQWKKIHENQIKQILIDMIKADEELGLYEEPKQETLEEDAEKYIETSHYMNKDRMADIIFGAKWQQERMYSEEDMIKLFDDYNEYLKDNNFPYIQFEQWLKAFKKE